MLFNILGSFYACCFTVFTAESSPAEGKSSVKETSTKRRKHAVKSKTQKADCADTELDKMPSAASSNEKSKHTPACKLFTLPQSGLYEHFLAKLKCRAYLARMKKQLVKHEGKVQCGKDVICLERKHSAKLLRLLNKIDDADGLKKRKKQTARKLSRLLQDVVQVF